MSDLPDKPTASHYRIGALLLALAAAVATLSLAVRGSARPVALNHSLASASATILVGAATLALLWLARRSDDQWRQILQSARVWQRAPIPNGNLIQFALLAVAAAVGQSLMLRDLQSENSVARDDQLDYLRVAREIGADHGGPAGLTPALYSGRFREDNRHPLYVALLSIEPTFAFGKWLSALFCITLTLVVGEVMRRRFGPLAGGVTMVLLAVNAAVLQAGSLVACETMLALLVAIVWIVISANPSPKPALAFVVGAVFGMAYLTKASAFMLLLATLIMLMAKRPPRWRGTVVAISAGFAVVAMPLLVRNAKVYGHPLHSFNNRFLFADSFEQGLRDPDLGLAGNWQRFRNRHSWPEILRDRAGAGLALESFVLLRSLGPTPLDAERAAAGIILLAAALATCVAEPRLGGVWLAAWVVVFVVFFAWYQPIAAGDRFLVPLVPPLLSAAAVGLIKTIGHHARGWTLTALVLSAVAVCTTATLAAVPS